MAMIAAGAAVPMIKEIVTEKNIKKVSGAVKWLLILGTGGIVILVFIFIGIKKGWFKNPFKKLTDPLGVFGGGLFGGGNGMLSGLGKIFGGGMPKFGNMFGKEGGRLNIRNIAPQLNRALESLKGTTKDGGMVSRINIVQSAFGKTKNKKTIDIGKQMGNVFTRKTGTMPKELVFTMDKKGKAKMAKAQPKPKAAAKPKIKIPSFSAPKKKKKGGFKW